MTKQIFLAANACMARGWFERHSVSSKPPSEGALFRAEQGRQIGKLARALHPSGMLIELADVVEAADQTRTAMDDPDVDVLFESAFVAGDFVARADILKRCKGGWEMHEVKMTLATTEDVATLTDDLAYTVMVARRCGVTIVRACLFLLSPSSRKGSPPSEIFVEVDRTREVEERLTTFDTLWSKIDQATAQPTVPPCRLTCECRGCEFFDGHCLGRGIEDHVLHLPNLHKSKIAKLGDAGVIDLGALPADFALTDGQQRAIYCIRSKKSFVAPTLKDRLNDVEFPLHFLDFESVMTAVPLYDGVAPFEQVLTQFSIHTCSAPGVIVNHAEYLADAERDCQHDLAVRLIADLGTAGSIVVYSSFEAVRISALAARFADLRDRLLRLKDRLVDLLPIVRAGYYHPSLQGSHSIKRLLPAVVPALTYDDLKIADGDSAVACFARMALRDHSADDKAKVRADLLAYCARDTLAMVLLHDTMLSAAI